MSDPKLSARMSRLGTESAFEILARAKALEAKGQSIINLGIGAPDFHTPDNVVEAAVGALRGGYHFYTPAKGLLDTREAVAQDIYLRRGVEVNPEHLMIVPGGKPTMFFAISMLGERGREIMYPNPGFPIYESMIKYSGAKAVPIELLESHGFSIDPEAVLSKINAKTSLIILNTPANPTGGVMDKQALDTLVAGLEKFPHVYVLADEIYSRLVYGNAKHTSLLGYESLRERLIVLDGWSKTYSMTGWRLGWGLWPAALIDHAERLQINSNSCASAAVQVAGAEALRGPQDSVDSMLAAFDQRRLRIVQELNDIPGFRCVLPEGAFYAFPNIEGTGLDSRSLQDKLLSEVGVATVAGTAFGHLGEGFLRFSYASSLEKILEALARVRTLLQPA